MISFSWLSDTTTLTVVIFEFQRCFIPYVVQFRRLFFILFETGVWRRQKKILNLLRAQLGDLHISPSNKKKNNNKKTEKKYILLMLLLTSLFIFILSATVVLSWKSFATLKTCTLISICVYGIPPTIVNGNEPQHWHGKCVNSSSYRVGMILWWCKYDDNFPLNSNIYKKQQQQHEQTLAIKKSQTNWETRVWLLHCEQFYA